MVRYRRLTGLPVQPTRTTLFGSFLAAYFLSQFFRSTNAVIAPNLAQEFALDASRLGLMTGLFFAAFAAVQLPLGRALDRYGPRRVTPVLMTAAAAGSLVFGAAGSFAALAAGRTLIGIGMAGVLVGALKAFREWFPASAYPAASGLFVGVGAIGALAAATPLAALTAAVGWRPVFLAAAAVTVLAALGIAIAARDAPDGTPASGDAHPRSAAPDRRGALAAVLTNNALWRMATMHLFVAGPQFAVQGLWGGPYLYDVGRLSPIAVGNFLLLLSGGLVAGYVSSGWIARRFGLVRTVTAAMLVFAATHVALGLQPPLPAIGVVYLTFGVAAGFGIMLLAHAGLTFPTHMGGQAITFVNLMGIGGTFLFQWGIGLILAGYGADGQGHYPAAAYRTAFLLTGAGTAAAALWYSRLRHGPYKA
ncbi:MAG: MFS transporter [Armatimonadota bacterium]|nr:MFS transporter [Armatimonadota bacterium]